MGLIHEFSKHEIAILEFISNGPKGAVLVNDEFIQKRKWTQNLLQKTILELLMKDLVMYKREGGLSIKCHDSSSSSME